MHSSVLAINQASLSIKAAGGAGAGCTASFSGVGSINQVARMINRLILLDQVVWICYRQNVATVGNTGATWGVRYDQSPKALDASSSCYNRLNAFHVGNKMQYLRYWSFREPPFGPEASHFFFRGDPQHQTLAWIQDLVVSRDRIGLITAASGCGATRLFTHVAKSHGFDDCAAAVTITSGRRSSIQHVHGDLAKSMGITVRRDALPAVANAIEQLDKQSIRTVWLVDGLGKHSADAIVQASRICRSLTVIANITPRLHRLVIKSLGKRIAETTLDALTLSGTTAFVEHSMQAAGCRKKPFSSDAINSLHQQSGGRIRSIVRIAQCAIQLGAEQQAEQITGRQIEYAAESLRRSAA
ncbi:hypothetical protein [Planctomycetes bacterium K23_9]|uniref:AAA+ ATPase domain-containing protein n=1 Tax=Stieleria marina TaxID=1930275 RepID=A0A517NTC2_9BACT|nr:hypothetical protein K239x_23150 [Planctomycetes bacterium K23_9]